LGVPFNIASYSLLTMMIAQVCKLEVGEFIHTFGDVHIYSNHLDQVEIQLKRKPKKLPRIKINPDIDDVFNFTFDDFELIDYNPHPAIKAVVSI
jgi:thymidylate synthase